MTHGGTEQPLTGWERPTGDQQPTVYEPPPTDYAPAGYVPQMPGPDPAVQPPPPSRRRIWIVAAAAAGALFLVAIALLLVFVPDRSGPAGEYDAAAKAFHARFDTLHPKLFNEVAAANSRMMDPSLKPVKDRANEIDGVFEAYANAVQAIVMPEAALEARTRLVRVTEAGQLLMTGVAAMFSKNQMQLLLDRTWPSVTKALGEAEADLRAALKK